MSDKRHPIGNPRTFDRGKPSPYAVICPIHGQAFLSAAEYNRQMNRPNKQWECPIMDSDPHRFGLCGATSEFDDDNLERYEPDESETDGGHRWDGRP